MRNVLNIEVRIVVPEGRMRPVNAARVEVLLDSMRKIGLLQPLVVGTPINNGLLWTERTDWAANKLTERCPSALAEIAAPPSARRDRCESCEVSPDQTANPPARGRAQALARRDLWPNQERRGSRKPVHWWKSAKRSP